MLSAHDAEIVRRDRELPGLAALLDTDAFLAILSEVFPEIGATAAAIQYVRYKPGASCLCLYQISGATGTADVYAKGFNQRRAEKLRHWHPAADSGSRRRRCRQASRRWHLGISRFPDDRRLKALASLHKPSSRERVLAAAFDHQVAGQAHGLTTLRYKPERRYVGSLTERSVAVAALKMYDGVGYREARARARLFETREALRIAACVGESALHGVLGFEWVSGHALQDELAGSEGLDAAGLAGVALAELHDQDVAGSLPRHGGALARAVRASAESVAAVHPRLATQARSLAARIGERLDESSWSARPAHGDFYAGQVIVTGRTAAILDLDRARLAHPAADLGTFAAHLELAALRGALSSAGAEAVLQALLRGYERRRPTPGPAHLATHLAAALLRLAPEPFRRHEDGWAELTGAILERAARALETGRQDRRGRPCAIQTARRVTVHDFAGLAGDPAWSFLRPALDPSESRRFLGAPLARLGATHAELREIRVSRHKPGRRCVVEYSFEREAIPPGSRPVVLLGKSRIKGLNANGQFALESLWNAGFTPSYGSVCVPQPLGAVPAWRMTLQRKVDGEPAAVRLAGPDGVRIAARIAEAIYELHARGAAPRMRHTLDDELRILRERLPRLEARMTPGRIAGLLDRCRRLAERVPRSEPRPIHRDFYPAHVLVDGERLWLIDLDLYCAGDPSLDVGNFLAHMIEERVRREGFAEGLTETESALESRYVQLAGRLTLPAIRAYTTFSLVRHIHLSTQYPDRRHTTQALFELCERRLSRGLESS